LYPLITARRKIGYDALRAKDGHAWFVNESIAPGCDHTLEGFLKFAEPLGIKKKVIRWDLFIDEDARAWARDTLSKTTRPRVIINPAASKPERNWPLARYIEVIRQLQQRWQAQIILTGGPGIIDREMGEAIEKEVSVMNVIGKTVPKQLLALIEQADVVLCPDTGPSHMGAAVGTPVIALHAVTSAKVSGPYTYRHLAVDCYDEAVKTILKKDKASNRWGTHAHGEETMKLVTVDAVLAQFERVFTLL
jgi:heptosyltransferase I